MSRIAVTGASGFIGRHLCAAAASGGVTCVALGRDSLRAGAIEPAIEGCDALLHLAGRAHVLRERSDSPEDEFRKVNVTLTGQVAAAARNVGVGRFVFVSSAGVLGQVSPPEGLDDQSPPQPYDAYTRSKLEAEQLLATGLGGAIPLTIVRPPLVYGPGARGNFERLVRAVLAGWPLPVGGLRARRSMVGVRNLVDLLLRAALGAGAEGATMLVADRELVTVGEFVRAVAHAAQRKPRIIDLPEPVLNAGLRAIGRSPDMARLAHPFVLRPSEAQRRLGWLPPRSLQEELHWTLASVADMKASRT